MPALFPITRPVVIPVSTTVLYAPGFLDGRSDVAAAYSMRRVWSAALGPLVRLRRVSDSVERDFGANQFAVSAPEVAAWVGGSSATVTKWYDQSGAGRDLAQSTASFQPAFSVLSNGLPGVTFDGTNDVLRASFTLIQPHARNIVMRVVTTPAAEGHVLDGFTNGGGQVYYSAANGSQPHIYAGGTLGSNDTSMPVSTRGVLGMTFNDVSSILNFNAATTSSFTGAAGSINPDGISVGASASSGNPLNVEVQELIQFNTAHTAGQLASDNAAMRTAWGF